MQEGTKGPAMSKEKCSLLVVDDEPYILPTLAALLAKEMPEPAELPGAPLAAKFPSIFERFSPRPLSNAVSVTLFPVDYSQLKTLMSHEHTFPSSAPTIVAGFKDFFRNKIVLLGDANPDAAPDASHHHGFHRQRSPGRASMRRVRSSRRLNQV